MQPRYFKKNKNARKNENLEQKSSSQENTEKKLPENLTNLDNKSHLFDFSPQKEEPVTQSEIELTTFFGKQNAEISKEQVVPLINKNDNEEKKDESTIKEEHKQQEPANLAPEDQTNYVLFLSSVICLIIFIIFIVISTKAIPKQTTYIIGIPKQNPQTNNCYLADLFFGDMPVDIPQCSDDNNDDDEKNCVIRADYQCTEGTETNYYYKKIGLFDEPEKKESCERCLNNGKLIGGGTNRNLAIKKKYHGYCCDAKDVCDPKSTDTTCYVSMKKQFCTLI